MVAVEQPSVDPTDHLLEVVPEIKVVICQACQYAVPPGQLREHLATRHAQLSKTTRRAIVVQINADARVAHHPRDVVYPKPQDPPLEGLPIHYDGLRCLGLDDRAQCQYVCRTIRGMQDHCRLIHGWRNEQSHGGDARNKQRHAANRMWERDRVCQQLFRTSNWKKYFEVSRNQPDDKQPKSA